MPLLTRALCSVRYVQCGAWQKRVAWHAARRLAEVLSPLLRQSPLPLPASADRVLLATELRLVAGQPIAMLGAVGRLDGGLGQRRLFLASADEETSAQRLPLMPATVNDWRTLFLGQNLRLITDKTLPLAFDQVDQTMLPRQTPSPETVGAILETAQHDLVRNQS